MLLPFRPVESKPTNRDDILRLLSEGQLAKALKACKKGGFDLDSFSIEVDACIRKMQFRRCFCAVLSVGYENDYVLSRIDVNYLLENAFGCGDYHGFLKNIYRFGKVTGFEEKIIRATEILKGKGQINDALGWERKIGSLSNNKGQSHGE